VALPHDPRPGRGRPCHPRIPSPRRAAGFPASPPPSAPDPPPGWRGRSSEPSRPAAGELLGVRLHSLDSAIERALRDWEAVEPLAAR